jgi:hypothetical protein
MEDMERRGGASLDRLDRKARQSGSAIGSSLGTRLAGAAGRVGRLGAVAGAGSIASDLLPGAVGSVVTGAATGAALGSVIPGVGTVAGAAVGGASALIKQAVDNYQNDMKSAEERVKAIRAGFVDAINNGGGVTDPEAVRGGLLTALGVDDPQAAQAKVQAWADAVGLDIDRVFDFIKTGSREAANAQIAANNEQIGALQRTADTNGYVTDSVKAQMVALYAANDAWVAAGAAADAYTSAVAASTGQTDAFTAATGRAILGVDALRAAWADYRKDERATSGRTEAQQATALKMSLDYQKKLHQDYLDSLEKQKPRGRSATARTVATAVIDRFKEPRYYDAARGSNPASIAAGTDAAYVTSSSSASMDAAARSLMRSAAVLASSLPKPDPFGSGVRR